MTCHHKKRGKKAALKFGKNSNEKEFKIEYWSTKCKQQQTLNVQYESEDRHTVQWIIKKSIFSWEVGERSIVFTFYVCASTVKQSAKHLKGFGKSKTSCSFDFVPNIIEFSHHSLNSFETHSKKVAKTKTSIKCTPAVVWAGILWSLRQSSVSFWKGKTKNFRFQRLRRFHPSGKAITELFQPQLQKPWNSFFDNFLRIPECSARVKDFNKKNCCLRN